MPRGDGTGPMGMGPMSGRAAGFCAGYATPGSMQVYAGRGSGMGRGRGPGRGLGMRRGWGQRWERPVQQAAAYPMPYAPVFNRQNEIDALKNQAKNCTDTLENINRRIAELETEENR